MVDYTRLLELLNYSGEAFEIAERFEYLVTVSGVLCDDVMCPDTSEPTLRIAWLIALGDYDEVEREFDYFARIGYYKHLQEAE